MNAPTPNDKYEILTGSEHTLRLADGVVLHRIRALRDITITTGSFPKEMLIAAKGDLGGWIATEHNLSSDLGCWVADDAKVYGKARVSDWAQVSGNAVVSQKAKISIYASVSGNAKVAGSATISDRAQVSDNAVVREDAKVSGDARVIGTTELGGTAYVHKNVALAMGRYDAGSIDTMQEAAGLLAEQENSGFYKDSKAALNALKKAAASLAIPNVTDTTNDGHVTARTTGLKK